LGVYSRLLSARIEDRLSIFYIGRNKRLTNWQRRQAVLYGEIGKDKLKRLSTEGKQTGWFP
jgi:hypothetical protein